MTICLLFVHNNTHFITPEGVKITLRLYKKLIFHASWELNLKNVTIHDQLYFFRTSELNQCSVNIVSSPQIHKKITISQKKSIEHLIISILFEFIWKLLLA